MSVTLETVQNLAPDQSSLTAAKKLLKPAKWPRLNKEEATHLIWGECQGSGANPYLCVADIQDFGYKCTCPSRKFPCKHVLALVWQYAESAPSFLPDTPPSWVNDWLGRRRRGKSSEPESENNKSAAKKNIKDVQDEPKLSAEEQEKKAAAAKKRAEKAEAARKESVRNGLLGLQQWIDDQLQAGIGIFIDEVSDRCRQIARRLVDAKASNLSSRLDELPAKLLSAPAEARSYYALLELGQLVFLLRAWLTCEDDPDIARAVVATEKRDDLLQSDAAVRHRAVWEVIGEETVSRRDSLISHSSWLRSISDEANIFALLLDFYPASSGKQGTTLALGEHLSAELIYYPSRYPLRAVIGDRYEVEGDISPSSIADDQGHLAARADALRELPWLERNPYLLPDGRIMSSERSTAWAEYWWVSDSGSVSLPLANETVSPVLLGSQLKHSFILWDGLRASMLSAQTQDWGLLSGE